MRTLAVEYAKNGVRVNAVSAGIIKTPMHAPENLSFLPRSIRWDVWEKYRKLWMPYFVSTRRHSPPVKFFTSTVGKRPATTRSLVFEEHLIDQDMPMIGAPERKDVTRAKLEWVFTPP
jgi:NAD(P)-dependent dehydrogenase (short-subunit alcohol dehydrogenase family)